MKNRVTVQQLCLIAMAVCINVAGGQLALMLRLPVYLDSIGTILTGALMGPVYGMLPNLLSGLMTGMTTDIYALYFAPVGMLTGLATGLVWKRMSVGGAVHRRRAFCERKDSDLAAKDLPGTRKMKKYGQIFLAALVITVPGTVVSALICAKLFGGITSSGSAVLVQLLAKTPLGMTASVFVVQIITDYLDRVISLFLVISLLHALPADMKRKWSGRRND